LLFHEVGEDAGVGGEAREGDAVVGVDGDYFLLVGGEFFGVALEERERVLVGGRWVGRKWGDGGCIP